MVAFVAQLLSTHLEDWRLWVQIPPLNFIDRSHEENFIRSPGSRRVTTKDFPWWISKRLWEVGGYLVSFGIAIKQHPPYLEMKDLRASWNKFYWLAQNEIIKASKYLGLKKLPVRAASSSLLGVGQPLGHVPPVGHLVDGLHVVGPHVLVLQVVGVLPNVDTEEGHKTGRRLERILQGSTGTIRTLF